MIQFERCSLMQVMEKFSQCCWDVLRCLLTNIIQKVGQGLRVKVERLNHFVQRSLGKGSSSDEHKFPQKVMECRLQVYEEDRCGKFVMSRSASMQPQNLHGCNCLLGWQTSNLSSSLALDQGRQQPTSSPSMQDFRIGVSQQDSSVSGWVTMDPLCFQITCRCPPLNLRGSMFESSDFKMTLCSPGEIAGAEVRQNSGGMPSGPGALWGFCRKHISSISKRVGSSLRS
jgi:hypothetical protein